MKSLFNYIKSLFPQEWILGYGEDVEFDEAWINISNPLDADIQLNIVIFPEQVGIGVVSKQEDDIEIDFSGFDINFAQGEEDSAKNFFDKFYQNGIPPLFYKV